MYKIKTEKEVVTVEVVEESVSLEEFVGYRVRTLREASGYTQESFLVLIKGAISITHLKNIEKGLKTMRLRDMEIICDALGVAVYHLFLESAPKSDS